MNIAEKKTFLWKISNLITSRAFFVMGMKGEHDCVWNFSVICVYLDSSFPTILSAWMSSDPINCGLLVFFVDEWERVEELKEEDFTRMESVIRNRVIRKELLSSFWMWFILEAPSHSLLLSLSLSLYLFQFCWKKRESNRALVGNGKIQFCVWLFLARNFLFLIQKLLRLFVIISDLNIFYIIFK